VVYATRALTSGLALDSWCGRSSIDVAMGIVANFNEAVVILVVNDKGTTVVGT
jgi:hypothetical protein